MIALETVLRRPWTSHLLLLLDPPPCHVTGVPQILTHIQANVQNDSRMDPRSTKQMSNKSSDTLSTMTFDYLRSSPKSPRRLPTITKQILIFPTKLKRDQRMSHILSKKYQHLIKYVCIFMNDLLVSMDYSWIMHGHL